MLTGNKREWVLLLKLVILPCGVHGRSPSFQPLGSGRCERWGSKFYAKGEREQAGLGRMRESAPVQNNPRRPWVIYGRSPEEVRIMPQTGDLPVRNVQICHGGSWTWIASVHTDSKQTLQLPLRPPMVAVPGTCPLRAQGPSGSSHVFALLHPSQPPLLSLPWTSGPSGLPTRSHLRKLFGNRKEFCIR